MNRQMLFEYVLGKYGTEPEYPWMDENAVLRHRENRKWYAAVLCVNRMKLGHMGEGTVDVLNVKCDPALIGSLRLREGYHPAYHMCKDKWISIRLDGTVPAEEIEEWLQLSYELTLPKKKK